MLNGSMIRHVGTVDRRRSVTGATIALASIRPDRYRRDYGPDNRGRGDYRNPRDEGYSGDSGYRRDQRDYRYDQR